LNLAPGETASFFAVLANLLPVSNASPPMIKLTELQESQRSFVFVLLGIYLLDLIFVWLQKAKFEQHQKYLVESNELAAAEHQALAAKKHVFWLKANFGAAIALSLLTVYLVSAPLAWAFPVLVSSLLIVIHIARFCYDISHTFGFYYPEALLSSNPKGPVPRS
jgi:hypothetical protein